MHRLTHRYKILSRPEAPPKTASPADFELAWEASSEQPHLPGTALAYCPSYENERVLFSLHEPADLAGLFAAPFLFPHQWRLAAKIMTVPFEQLAGIGLCGPALQPCFVFSPGRTGSTLLVRLLEAAGLACVSEPDMLQQVVWLHEENRRKLPADIASCLAGACIAALGRARGHGVIIKLRSQCNEDPLVITRSSPGCRAVFMLRRVAPWAMSRHRVFLEPPAAVAAVLRQAIDALDTLTGAGVPIQVLWFETLAADPQSVLRLFAPTLHADTARVASAMAIDSQAGTPIARKMVASRPVQDGFLGEFGNAWSAARAGAEWSAATETLLKRMWDG